MKKTDHVVVPAVSSLLYRVAEKIEESCDVVIIGPMGSGVTTAGRILSTLLEERELNVVWIDCREGGGWRESIQNSNRQNSSELQNVIIIDHGADLPFNEINLLKTEIEHLARRIETQTKRSRLLKGSIRKKVLDWLNSFRGRKAEKTSDKTICVWLGSYDCYSLTKSGFNFVADPTCIFYLPEYKDYDLHLIYESIGKRQECDWGDAIPYLLSDWCGTDLRLAEGVARYLYGNWRERVLYDGVIRECLENYLKDDRTVDYRRGLIQFAFINDSALLQLLNVGGKLPVQAPFCHQDTNDSTRELFLGGILSANLLPGYYQYRNLTVKLLSQQIDEDIPPITTQDLLRISTNARIGAMLQDVEITLRQLLMKCFAKMGYDAVKQKLEQTKTDEKAFAPELRKALLDWAKSKNDAVLQEELGKLLTAFQKEFDQSHSLWARTLEVFKKDVGDVQVDANPPLVKIVEYMTFNELTNLILSLADIVFLRAGNQKPGEEPPKKRWPTYVARILRLRNQSAHLRNISFQDFQDLLMTMKQMRWDIEHLG